MKVSEIREGDLLKFTNKADPRISLTSNALEDGTSRHFRWRSKALNATLVLADWDIELLDRPLPPIDEELLEKAVREYLNAAVLNHPLGSIARKAPDSYYRHGVKAVINAVREYDRKNATKENA